MVWLCEECRASLQGRNKDRLLNVLHLIPTPCLWRGIFLLDVPKKDRPLKAGLICFKGVIELANQPADIT